MSHPEPTRAWRTVDIVAAAVIAVALGFIFLAWKSDWPAYSIIVAFGLAILASFAFWIGNQGWRTVDIVVASVIAVAFGVVFWAWNNLWTATEGAFLFFPPARALLYGVWLVPAVLAALIIRKPGAAVYTETLAAVISALLGTAWGAAVIPQGLIEGLGAEIAFAIFAYRSFGLATASLAGALAGLAATGFDAIVWYPGTSWLSFRLPYVGFGTLSSLIIAGAGAWMLTRALAETGALAPFASGRDRAVV
jgi:energy-coupling factor transport system substrate-specific component